jgi:hypothetical protein
LWVIVSFLPLEFIGSGEPHLCRCHALARQFFYASAQIWLPRFAACRRKSLLS